MNFSKKNHEHQKIIIKIVSKKSIKQLCTLCISLIVLSCNESNSLENNSKKNIAGLANDSLSINGIHIENPKTVENLSLFILTGEEKIKGNNYKTLSQAMESKEVIVKETGTVSQLSIDNTSDATIFIHSGDIVKGGKQDRTISYDVIIPPNTKNIPLESFCVEQGRWQQRENETVTSFASNTKMLSSRDLKSAAKHEKNESKVWSSVSEQKDKLSEKLSKKNGYTVDVANKNSATSLQLALESDELSKVKKEYLDALNNLIDTPNAIGYAYAINGEIYGVEVYNNKQLFKDLWEKILESIIVEAIGKKEDEKHSIAEDVVAFIKVIIENDKETAIKINEATYFKTLENKSGHLIFTSEDTNKKQWVHKSYMKGNPSSTSKKSNSRLRTMNHN